jgi:hypothetical protein
MAARRLLIVMLVLLGISALAAALVPGQRLNQGTSSTSTSTEETTAIDTLPQGRLLTATISAARPKQQVVQLKLGDELILLVKANVRDDVEIPALGLVEAVDPVTPARFDLLPTQTGSYPIRLVTGLRRVGRIQVLPRKSETAPKVGAKADGNPEAD